MTEETDTLDMMLGEEIVGYHYDGDMVYLKLSNGEIVNWSGHYSHPTNYDDEGTKERQRERLRDKWKHKND